jgi:site-specific DNA recombinase
LFKEKSLSTNQQASLIKNAKAFSLEWDSHAPHQQIIFLKAVLQKICISCDGVNMHITIDGLLNSLDKSIQNKKVRKGNDDIHILNVPAKLKRYGIEMKLIINNHDIVKPHQLTIKALQDALLKALLWHDEITTGKVASTTALARRENVTQRYIGQIIKLAFLAPDIMEAIIQGTIPLDLTLTRLKKGFPLDWSAQRQDLSFTA